MINYKTLEINDTEWFTNVLGTIGIIYCTDTITSEKKIYIGNGKGLDSDEDIKRIIDWGTKLNDIVLEI